MSSSYVNEQGILFLHWDNSIDKLNQLHPKLRAAALTAYGEAVHATPVGVHPVIDQTYRTFAESDKLYQQGRTTPGEIVSNAKAGQSFHQYGLALDFHLVVNGKDSWDVDSNWNIVVDIFKNHGFTWGGNWTGGFKDYPHLEQKMGYTWQKLLEMYQNNDTFIDTNGLTYVKL
jgi:peptidoglycan LD-endopeptidase CwlK